MKTFEDFQRQLHCSHVNADEIERRCYDAECSLKKALDRVESAEIGCDQLASFARYGWEDPKNAQVITASVYLSVASGSDPAYLAAQRFLEKATPEQFELVKQIGCTLPFKPPKLRIPALAEHCGDLRVALASCVMAMRLWGDEEDGIPEDGPIAHAYEHAEALLRKHEGPSKKMKGSDA